MIVLPLVLVVAAATGGILYYMSKNQSKVAVYSVSMLNSADWWEEDSSLSGVLTSDYVQEVKLEGSREIEKIYVKAGDTVKEGDKLLKYNMEEEELDLQLQELQIKSSTLALENLQNELDKLKGTKTTGSIDSDSDTALGAASGMLSVRSDQILYLAEGEDETSSEATTAAESDSESEKKEDTDSGSDKKDDSDSDSDKKDDSDSDSDKKDDSDSDSDKKDSSDDSKDQEEDSQASTESSSSEATTEQKVNLQDEPLTENITKMSQRAKYSSGDGKTAKTPYLFLLLKKKVVETDEKGQKKEVLESYYNIKGSIINTIISKGMYATFKEYDSQEAFEKNPDKPSDELTITPDSRFTETISEKASYTVSELEDLLITVTKVKITPTVKTVETGNTYTFAAKVTGKHISGLTASWKVSGNKASDTIMSGGSLFVSTSETAKKLKITVTVNDKKATMTVKVKKGSSSSGSGSSSLNGGSGSSGLSDSATESYTAAELKEAIEDKEEEIATAKTELSEAKISYEEAKQQVEEATIKAKISGTVETAYTIDALPTDETPVVVVRADDGIYVKTQINEMDLDTVKVGGTIICKTWDTEEEYEAIVKEVSDYPSSSASGDGDSGTNPNSSYYPIVAYIEDAEGLSPGDSVSISYNSQSMGTVEGDAIYLQKAYVRSDSDGSYVYKVDENKRLTKQYISTGKTLNGQYIEVLAGITTDDYLAFPYGKKVKEGAKTEISEDEENIIY